MKVYQLCTRDLRRGWFKHGERTTLLVVEHWLLLGKSWHVQHVTLKRV